MSEHHEFKVKPLAYPYNALEPYIDTLTMTVHHDKHLKTYIDNLNLSISKYPEYKEWSLERLIKNSNWLPEDVRTKVKNNAGGVYNHNFYFANMSSKSENNVLSGKLKKDIDYFFGNLDRFKSFFKQSALGVFGSGYAWLIKQKNDELKIIQTKNQDTPLELGFSPVLCIDVWEHAYYLKHKNARVNYIDNWFNVVNWKKIEKDYESLTRTDGDI